MSREFKSFVQRMEKPFTVHPPVNIISEKTKKWVLECLSSIGVQNVPDDSFEWTLKDEKGTSFSKRLKVWIERFAQVQYKEWDFEHHQSSIKTTLDKGTIDNNIRYIGTELNLRAFHHPTLYVDCIKGPFNWKSKEFGYPSNGSCWWDTHCCASGLYTCGGNSNFPCELNGLAAKNHYADHNGYCIRFFTEKNMLVESGIGRIWLWPSIKEPRTGILFNGYYNKTGNYSSELSNLIIDKFRLSSKEIEPKTVYYLNSGSIFLVGPKRLLTKTIVIKKNTPLFEI